MLQTDNEKKLSPERYDAKLFNQVYKANLKAKTFKEESDQKRKKLLTYLGIGLVVLLVTTFFIFKPKPRENYVALGDVSGVVAYHSNIPLPVINGSSVLGAFDLDLSASSVLVYDLNSNTNILVKDMDGQYPIASLTKLVTVMVMIDTYGLDYQLEITKDLTEDLEWTLGLGKGDVISTDQLLEAMLISSYNDAAYVVANEYGYEEYMALMNDKVKSLGCENTHFENPMGYDSKNHFSTVRDLKTIVNLALKYPSVLEISKKKGANISWISEGSKEEKYIYTTNRLVLDYPNVRGLKTGFTAEAGECLITFYDDMKGDRFVVILLDSEDRFGETENIIKSLLY